MGTGQQQIEIEYSKNGFSSWVCIYIYIFYRKFQWGLQPPLGLNQLLPGYGNRCNRLIDKDCGFHQWGQHAACENRLFEGGKNGFLTF